MERTNPPHLQYELLQYQIDMLKGTIAEREREIKRLKRVCVKNDKDLQELERMIRSEKKWYHFIIWQK